MNRRQSLPTVSILMLLLSSSLVFSQDTRRPFPVDRFITVYNAFKDSRGGELSKSDRDHFAQSVIRRHGLGFAPTPKLRERLSAEGVDAEMIANLCEEISRGRGIGVYVFAFNAKNAEIGRDFARLIHLEVERQKPRILEIVDRKEFLPNATSYDDWKNQESDIYAFYVTGDISGEEEGSALTAKIRFRAVRSKVDSTVEIPPLELRSKASRESATTVANWFVDAMISTCVCTKDE